jgi:hypothetical protein
MDTLKKIDREYWLKEIAAAKKSAKNGYTQAAVKRLARLQRSIQKEVSNSVISNWSAALVHQLIAGMYSESGNYHNANIAYLKAATLAFHDVYSSISMITNSLSAAERDALSAQEAVGHQRLIQIQKVMDNGSRFTKEVGDMLNDQLIDAKLSPVIFGGAYPGKVGLTPEQHKAFERRRSAIHRQNAKLYKAWLREDISKPKKRSKK